MFVKGDPTLIFARKIKNRTQLVCYLYKFWYFQKYQKICITIENKRLFYFTKNLSFFFVALGNCFEIVCFPKGFLYLWVNRFNIGSANKWDYSKNLSSSSISSLIGFISTLPGCYKCFPCTSRGKCIFHVFAISTRQFSNFQSSKSKRDSK
jgi:hypothetical protein